MSLKAGMASTLIILQISSKFAFETRRLAAELETLRVSCNMVQANYFFKYVISQRVLRGNNKVFSQLVVETKFTLHDLKRQQQGCLPHGLCDVFLMCVQLHLCPT